MFNKAFVRAERRKRNKNLNKQIMETMDKFMKETDYDKARLHLEELKNLEKEVKEIKKEELKEEKELRRKDTLKDIKELRRIIARLGLI